MAKRHVSAELLEKINRFQFGLAEKFMTEYGCVDPAVHTFDVSETKILQVGHVPLPKDYKEYIGRKLPRLIARNSVVVVTVEAWQTILSEGVQEKNEIVGVTVYANDKAYFAAHAILRDPLRLVYGDITETETTSGTIAPGGAFAQLNPQAIAKLVSRLRDLVKRGGVKWEAEFTGMLRRFVAGSPNIQPVTEMLYDVSLPAERASTANRILDHLLTVIDLPDAPPTAPNRMWLTGIPVHIGDPTDDTVDPRTLPSGDELLSRLASNIRELMPPYIPFYPAPRGEAYAIESYLPVSTLNGLSRWACEWQDPETPPLDEIKTYIDERNMNCIEKYAHTGMQPPACVLFAAAFDRHENFRDPFSTTHDDEWDVPTDVIEGFLLEAAAKTTRETGVLITTDTVSPAYDALHALDRVQMMQKCMFVMDFEELDRSTVVAELTMASFPSPVPHEKAFVVLNKGDGNFATALRFHRKPHHMYPDMLQDIADILRTLGVIDVRIYPSILPADYESSSNPIDVFAPDFRGGWFSVSDMKIPAAKGMLRKAGWEYVDRAVLADEKVSRLPYPHRIARAGLAEVIQRHYSSTVYKILKEVCGIASIPTDHLWDAVCEREPRFQAFMEAMPNWSRPDDLATRSTRFIWGKAPTLITTGGLSERLALTDINLDKLPARFLNIPYPITYLHFQTPPPNAVLNTDEDGQKESFVLEGAFLESYKTEISRKFQFVPIWRSTTDPNHSIFSVVTLAVDDDLASVGDYLARHYEEIGLDAGVISEDMESISEIVKVLVYLNLKDARTIPKPVRSDLLRGSNKKSVEQRLKILARAAGLCDHILVGPETSMHTFTAPGASERSMPVHARRGHLHTYRTGKGRTEVTLKFVEPIIVNKHLLQDGDAPPSLKDYHLK